MTVSDDEDNDDDKDEIDNDYDHMGMHSRTKNGTEQGFRNPWLPDRYRYTDLW